MTVQTLLSPQEDVTGKETLDLFAETRRFNEWMFSTLSHYCKDNILEIGSGIGNISRLLLEKYEKVSLSDLRESYCDILKKKFSTDRHLQNVYQLDLGEADLHRSHSMLIGQFDSVIASNVVEHVENDVLAIRNCYDLLKMTGRLVVLVPAYGVLYNGLDRELGHFRRYNRSTMTDLLKKQGFSIVHSQYFNAAGIFGWWLSGTVQKKTMLPKNQLDLYNKLIPFIRLIDKISFNKMGLSLIMVGEKN
jgi:2-polyprenyl-3-methyl-5-hydroxy-6-metoxy-1,4-benzoquinol methylase